MSLSAAMPCLAKYWYHDAQESRDNPVFLISLLVRLIVDTVQNLRKTMGNGLPAFRKPFRPAIPALFDAGVPRYESRMLQALRHECSASATCRSIPHVRARVRGQNGFPVRLIRNWRRHPDVARCTSHGHTVDIAGFKETPQYSRKR